MERINARAGTPRHRGDRNAWSKVPTFNPWPVVAILTVVATVGAWAAGVIV